MGAALIRQVRFPGKMMLITVAFMVPIVWVLLVMVSGKLIDIGFTQQERAGVRYAIEVYPVLDLAGV